MQGAASGSIETQLSLCVTKCNLMLPIMVMVVIGGDDDGGDGGGDDDDGGGGDDNVPSQHRCDFG